MNILYLLKILETNKLSELVAHIDLPPLDINLALWAAIDAGEVEIDEKNDQIKALKEAQPWQDPVLSTKLLRAIQHYAKNESNITVGRMNSYMKDQVLGTGYPTHEYLMSMQFLIDNGQVIEEVINVPQQVKRFIDKKGRKKEKVTRPEHTFVFLCLPENAEHNQEWNARAVNKWLAEWENTKVK